LRLTATPIIKKPAAETAMNSSHVVDEAYPIEAIAAAERK
jgi:hypothetical protein